MQNTTDNRLNNRLRPQFSCYIFFSMKLQNFLVSLLVLNTCCIQNSEASCQMANWWGAFDHQGWATCDSSTQYIKGLWRNDRESDDEIYSIEEAKCCTALSPYNNTPSTCQHTNWWGTLDK